MSDQARQAERLERALRSALADLQSATLGRDIADLTVDQQKKKFYQKQIDEILARMKSKSAVEALSTPLTETYMAGFSRKVFTQVPDGSSLFGDKVLANFSIDTDKLKALTNAVLNPLQSAGDNLHSPLPFIAPSLDPMGVEKMLEIAMKGAAKGSSWAELSKDIADALPGAAKLVKDELKKGYQVEFPSGYRMPAEKYAKVLARTTSVWAGNKGALDRADDAGSPCMLVAISPGTCDFCVALEGKVYAITADAADKYGVALLSECPNGGPPFHVNCRHALAPFTPRKADAGKLSKPPKELLTRAEGKDAPNSAQSAYEDLIKKDPLPYAKQLAETAARRGFGEKESDVPPKFRAMTKAYADKEGNAYATDKKALTEDYHVAKRIAAGETTDRKEYLQSIATALRQGAKNGDFFHADEGLLHYYDKESNWIAMINANDADVISAFPLKGETWEQYQKRKERNP